MVANGFGPEIPSFFEDERKMLVIGEDFFLGGSANLVSPPLLGWGSRPATQYVPSITPKGNGQTKIKLRIFFSWKVHTPTQTEIIGSYMNLVTVGLGIFFIIYGITTYILRLYKPGFFWKLEPMKQKWGEKRGYFIHVFSYSILPVVLGIVYTILGVRD